MPYYVTGSATYSSQTNRNNAQAAINAVLAGTTGWAGGKYPAGVATNGTTGLTISVMVNSDAQVDAIREAIRSARAPYPVTAGHFSVVRVE